MILLLLHQQTEEQRVSWLDDFKFLYCLFGPDSESQKPNKGMLFRHLFRFYLHYSPTEKAPLCELSFDQWSRSYSGDCISSICSEAAGILLHSSPFVCRGRGRILMSLPLTKHPWKVRLALTPAVCKPLESLLPSLPRTCCLENMRAARGADGSAACVEETLRNVDLHIASTSSRTAKNAAIVSIKNRLFIINIEHL